MLFINKVFIVSILIIILSYIGILKLEKKNFPNNPENIENIVDIIFIENHGCKQCRSLNSYLKVYKASGVQFGNITTITYGGLEYQEYIKQYNIKKLPFIIFSKELSQYDTISKSWENTFGYKNKQGQFIPTDIIPPYYNIETQQIEGLVDMTYIGDKSCIDCYKSDDIKNILSEFGIQFKKINILDISNTKVQKLRDKYKINKIPGVILSRNIDLYENFSYFWESLGTKHSDGAYILREPEKFNLIVK